MLTVVFKKIIPAAALLMLLAAPASYAVDVKDVRLWRAPDHTRVVLDLSAKVTYKIMQIPEKNPDRIVIDIKNARIKADLSKVDLHDSPIKRIRSGIQEKKDLRIVLDVSSGVKPRSFLLKKNKENDDRLVIDLYDKKSKPVVKHVAQVDQRRDIVIAIDAGHGGEDPGAIGPGKLHEKKVVMAIAKELNYLFQQEKGYKPVLIRTGDYYVGLSKRRKIARNAQADLLVSIHADAFKDRRAKGSSIYALSGRGATSAMAKFLAEEANSSDLVGGISLSDKDDLLAGVLTDLSMNASLDTSMQIGNRVLKSMGKVSKLHSKKVEQASFVVLKSPDIPSILVESGFISNPTEAKNLNSKAYQRKMARAIYTGIKDYFSYSPPQDTYVAWEKRNRIQTVKYTIASGDTLSGIAERYRVSVASIRRHNDLTTSVIKVGQTITIPAT